MMDYTFKIKVLVGDLERGVPPVYDYDDDDDGGLHISRSGSRSNSDSEGVAPPAATTSA
jgi:hypothetical protein